MCPQMRDFSILCKTLVLIFVLMSVLILPCTATEKVFSLSLCESIPENKTSLDFARGSLDDLGARNTSYFFSSYELGDLSDWDDSDVFGAPSKMSVVSNISLHGMHSCRAFSALRFSRAMAIKRFSPSLQSVYVCLYVWFETLPDVNNPQSPGSANMYAVYLRNDDAQKQLVGGFARQDAEGVYWDINWGDSGGFHYPPTHVSFGPQTRQWYSMELMCTIGSGNGSVAMWINGTKIYDVPNVDNALIQGEPIDGVDSVYIGCGEGPGILYTDHVEVSDSYIGSDPDLDLNPPIVSAPSREPDGDVDLGKNVTVSVNVTDAESGMGGVTLSYTVDNEASWVDVSMKYDLPTGQYQGTIRGQEQGVTVRYRIIAHDNVHNFEIEDNAGHYYVYTVIPEFLTWPIFLTTFFVITILIVLLNLKIMSKGRS